MTTIYILESSNDECHRVHGATLSLWAAECWVADMQNRQLALNNAQQVINDAMGAWADANPLPKPTHTPNLLKTLHKIPRKDRTPEILAQIEAAKAEMTLLLQDQVNPLCDWYDARLAEIARLKATFPEQIQHDFEDLPAYDDFSYTTTTLY